MKNTNFKFKGLVEYSDATIIEEINRVAKIVAPNLMTTSEFKRHANVGISTVRRHFITWRNALTAAGLAHIINTNKVVTNKMIDQKGKGMSDDDLLALLRNVSKQLGKDSITCDEFNSNTPISAATLCRRFHGWGNAIELAGLKPDKIQKRYSDVQCYENLLKVWTYYRRPPKLDEMTIPPSTIGMRAYIKRWGTWRKTLKAFVDQINQDVRIDLESNTEPNKKLKINSFSSDQFSKSPKPESEIHSIKLGLRYTILKRDRFRCVICGRSPSSTLGLELHVDHIVPFSEGGKTFSGNLRSTCSECNIGKGSKLEES